jgi:shikimate dehydrogenase
MGQKFIYGLIGKQLSHSFSKHYFTEKFKIENILNTSYNLYELQNIDEFPALIKSTVGLKGLNVTVPYKESVLPYLYHLSEEAKQVGAVNTIKVNLTPALPKNRDRYSKGEGAEFVIRNENMYIMELYGYNTDVVGFRESLLPILSPNHKKALVLGTGGASKAITYVLKQLGIEYLVVSRMIQQGLITYEEINKHLLDEYLLIINASPVGMYPYVENTPEIPYEHLSARHLLYDLVYNPEMSLFLKKGMAHGANIKNGKEMLLLQAKASWNIWNRGR